jgi:NAD(P)-dependent dehydrogenase (short-subunit alcohol dehydrogenase family)
MTYGLEEGKAITQTQTKANIPIFRLDGKVAVVTGGASGIGQAIAELFALQGARVHLLDLNVDQASRVAAAIRDDGAKATAHLCDVTDWSSTAGVFDRIFGQEEIDVLVNSAGIAHVGKLEDTGEEDFDLIFRVNVKGVYHCMRACVEHMKSRRQGTILNLASIAGSAGLPDRFAYSMSKGAVQAMTYSVARDYLSCNIRCNCISPARIHTPFVDAFVRTNYPGREKEITEKLAAAQPIGRMGQPREVGALALYLCSDEAAFVTGADYPLDGGFLNLR